MKYNFDSFCQNKNKKDIKFYMAYTFMFYTFIWLILLNSEKKHYFYRNSFTDIVGGLHNSSVSCAFNNAKSFESKFSGNSSLG